MRMPSPPLKLSGLVVRSTPGGKTLSLWRGDTEMIAELDAEQAASIARAMSGPRGVLQILGAIRQFNVPRK